MHKIKVNYLLPISIIVLIFTSFYLIYLEDFYYNNYNNIFKYQIVFVAIGLLVFIVARFIDLQKVKYISTICYITVLILILLVSVYGIIVNDQRMYVSIGRISFQPIVISIPFAVISFSGFLNNLSSKSIKYYYLLIILYFIPLALIYFISNSLFCLMLLFFVYVGMFTIYIISSDFIINKRKILRMLYLIVAICLLIFLFINLTPEKIHHIYILMNPERDPVLIGYWGNIINKVIEHANLIGASELIGEIQFLVPVGYSGLSSDYTFIFSIESLGWFWAIAYVLVLSVVIVFCWLMALKTVNTYNKLISVGFSIIFTLQVLGNILMNLGGPTMSCYLPFVSYSGFNLVCDLFMLSFIINAYNRDM